MEAAKKETRMMNPELIEKKVPAFASSLASIHGESKWKDVLRKTAKMMLGLASGEKLSNQELESIHHRVLIGIGSKDRMVSVEESEEIANTLPNGRLEIIEDFQHPIEKIDVDKLSSLIVGFMKG
jgi:pimeloyl-ACP methyl ester carboxylesterase